jgi:hypothetical protein
MGGVLARRPPGSGVVRLHPGATIAEFALAHDSLQRFAVTNIKPKSGRESCQLFGGLKTPRRTTVRTVSQDQTETCAETGLLRSVASECMADFASPYPQGHPGGNGEVSERVDLFSMVSPAFPLAPSRSGALRLPWKGGFPPPGDNMLRHRRRPVGLAPSVQASP